MALDVYLAERGRTQAFEQSGGFSNSHSTGVVVHDALCAVRFEKFTARIIVFKAKLISEEAKCDVSISVFVSASPKGKNYYLPSRDVSESIEPLTLNEHVHKIAAHVLGCKVQLEEPVVVAKSQGGANIKCMLDPRL